jgi:hypothetical protein
MRSHLCRYRCTDRNNRFHNMTGAKLFGPLPVT